MVTGRGKEHKATLEQRGCQHDVLVTAQSKPDYVFEAHKHPAGVLELKQTGVSPEVAAGQAYGEAVNMAYHLLVLGGLCERRRLVPVVWSNGVLMQFGATYLYGEAWTPGYYTCSKVLDLRNAHDRNSAAAHLLQLQAHLGQMAQEIQEARDARNPGDLKKV